MVAPQQMNVIRRIIRVMSTWTGWIASLNPMYIRRCAMFACELDETTEINVITELEAGQTEVDIYDDPDAVDTAFAVALREHYLEEEVDSSEGGFKPAETDFEEE